MTDTGDLDNRDGKAATEFVEKMLHWKDEYFDMDIDKFRKIALSKAYNGVVFVEHTWQQLKKSVAWYEEQCRLTRYEEEKILREINLQRISGTSASPFKRQDMIYLNNHKKDPVKEIDYSKNLQPILFYEPLYTEYPYLLCIDPSEGLGGDNNALTLINPYTLCVAAEYKSRYISQKDMFKMACQFMDEYCPNSMIVIEANKGREIIQYFLDSKYRYRLYYDIDKLNSKIVESTDPYGALKRASNERRAFGIDTSRSSRPKMFNILLNMVEEQKDKLYSIYIVDDITHLEKKNDRIAAAQGSHDDNIMSYLIGLYVYWNASNLEEFGIVRGATEPSNISASDSPEKIRDKLKAMMAYLPEEYQDIFKTTTDEKDPVSEAWKYQQEVQRHLNQDNNFADTLNHVMRPGADDYENFEKRQQELDEFVFDTNFNQDNDVHIEDYIN